MTPDELRTAQDLAMANPERLHLLARMLTHPAGRSSAADLVPSPGSRVADVRDDLAALVSVGLVAVVGQPAAPDAPDTSLYRVSSRGIARFGSAALAAPRRPGDATLDEHDHEALLARLTDTLSADFAATAGAGTVERLVRECYTSLGGQIGSRGQLPALTAWLATDRLAAMAEVTYGSPRDVLFVCVDNTGRSQIAAAVTRRLAGDRVRVRTAGIRPAAREDAMTETVLARRGLDGLVEFPRLLTDDVVRASGIIVTMGCGDACPVFPGRRYLDWPLADPAGRPLEEVERMVDDITDRVRALLAEIDTADGSVGVPPDAAPDAGPAVLPLWARPGWLARLTRRPWAGPRTTCDASGQRKAR
ncbi:low molecular weight phosphatase family protein [Promicromonospora thailandica]|uniref:Protein-tyrosine-phosphatase n=1 Tax=Promicromonospora thailandica TaxID=765201 RepID=A0A9X2JW24_9MICO|nr:low molecular weight phosphatase family protein [Promicromonospora thailandica]MCP2265097.1 Protein-tyrosine-phosphatase [Promicromonospora thailandica]